LSAEARTPRRSAAVLFGEADARVTQALTVGLQRRGHDVRATSSGEELLARPDFDVLVADTNLPGKLAGLELVAALRELGSPTAAVLVGDAPDFAVCRQALRLGVVDFLAKPASVDELVAAVEAALPRERAGCPAQWERAWSLETAALEDVTRDLVVELVRRGVGPAHRIRIATAVSELLERVLASGRAHAPAERLALSAVLRGSTVDVRITCSGEASPAGLVGPLPRASRDAAMLASDSLSGALARARALSERLEYRAGTNGVGARLVFELEASDFEEEGHGLDLDFLLPAMTRELVAAQLAGRAELTVLPSPVAATVGRLLAACLMAPEPATTWSA
jgi:FixJ family two-component response regulator